MTAIPGIAICAIFAALSMVATTILSKPWMRYVALGCAIFQTAVVWALLIIATRS